MNFRNQQTAGGKTEISFKMVTFAKVMYVVLMLVFGIVIPQFLEGIFELTWELYIIPFLTGFVVYWIMYYQFVTRKDNLLHLINSIK